MYIPVFVVKVFIVLLTAGCSKMPTEGGSEVIQGPSDDSGASAISQQVKPPKTFDFAKYEEWPRWIKWFDCYRVVSGLQSQGEELQVNALLYAMGGDAEDIMATFFSADEGDSKKYDVVKEKFDSHFITKKNVIYERAKVNQRAQG